MVQKMVEEANEIYETSLICARELFNKLTANLIIVISSSCIKDAEFIEDVDGDDWLGEALHPLQKYLAY
jgi:hypothetical protein